MPRPICAKCSREMRCKKNEVLVNDRASAGFRPTFWSGDSFECEGCGAEVVTGFGEGFYLPPDSPESIEFSERQTDGGTDD